MFKSLNAVDILKIEEKPKIIIILFLLIRFTYYATGLDDMMKVRKSLFMFVDLFGVDRFEYETLVSS